MPFDWFEEFVCACWQPFIDAYWAAEYARVCRMLEKRP